MLKHTGRRFISGVCTQCPRGRAHRPADPDLGISTRKVAEASPALLGPQDQPHLVSNNVRHLDVYVARHEVHPLEDRHRFLTIDRMRLTLKEQRKCESASSWAPMRLHMMFKETRRYSFLYPPVKARSLRRIPEANA